MRLRVASIVTLFVLATVMSTTSAKANDGSLRVVTHSSYVDSLDYVHIVGVVSNDTSLRQRFVRVIATFRNGSGQVVGSDFTYTSLEELVPHATSPFHLIASVPSYESYTLTVEGSSMTGWTLAPLAIEPGPAYTDGLGYLHLPGLVRNKSTANLEFTQVVATIYAGTAVLTTDFTYTDPDTIGPNGSASFEVIVTGPHDGYTRVNLQAEADANDSGYAASWDNYFGDLGGSVFRADVVWLAEAGITGGCAPGRYCPTASVTRAQMASFLSRALGLSEGGGVDYFDDDNTSPHEIDINRVAYAGITGGCGERRFCPGATVTRAEMASFLARALGLTEGGSVDYFTDDNTSIHETNINRVAYAGITGGCATAKYCPSANVTRGQMAAFLRRAFE